MRLAEQGAGAALGAAWASIAIGWGARWPDAAPPLVERCRVPIEGFAHPALAA